tara:strand:+ start:775 stop:966 length:192 start_codon:yes stop_codon:yes gene_type:complete
MPIWLRKYTFSEISKFYEEEKQQHENASKGNKGQKSLIDSSGKVNAPAFANASKAYKGKTSYK